MIDRVERLPRPDPDVRQFLTAVRRGVPGRVPLIELKLDDEVVAALQGEPIIPWRREDSPETRRRSARQHIALWHRLGYDAFRLRAPLAFGRIRDRAEDTAALTRGQREWQNEHTGPIASRADVETYPWPRVRELDFGQAEDIIAELPDGMGCIGYASGVFEWSSWLMGLERFCVVLRRDRELIRQVTERVGEAIYQTLKVFSGMRRVVALWVGDDLGFKTGTLVRPEDLREFILPCHARYAELAHAHGMPYLLHSCGNLRQIIPDLIAARVDARHSYEDEIQPVEAFAREWGERIAVLGGVDVDVLARGDEPGIVRRTQQILEACAPAGGYCAGSGNSICNYVPVDHYLAMVETVHRFNGRM